MACILAIMIPNPRKKLESYIRLLNLFELELKRYHSIFDNNKYRIDYVIKRERFSNDVEIKLIVTILQFQMWRSFTRDPVDLKRILGNYCSYFSVSDFTIVRPIRLYSQRNTPKTLLSIPPIEERVGFDLFIRETRWYTI